MDWMNALTQTLISLSGDQNVLVVRKPMVKFTGSIEAAILLNQLLYWSDKTETGWIAKGDEAFAEELCLTIYGVRKAKEQLQRMGFLETKIKKFNGTPMTHYRLDLEHLVENWTLWIQKADSAKSKSPLCENADSIIETTTETTIKKDSVSASPSRATAKKPKQTQPAAVKVFRSKAHRFPSKSWWKEVDAVVGDDPADLERWGEVVFNWCGLGWNPTNVKGMLDCFKKNETPGDYAKHKNGRASPMDRSIAAVQRVLAECEANGNA